MIPNDIIADAKGINWQENEFTARGALTRAENCIMPRPGIVERRPGFDFYKTNLPALGDPFQLLSLGGAMHLQHDDGLWYDDGTDWERLRIGSNTKFSTPDGLWVTSSYIYVASSAEHCIKRVDRATGRVIVWAGSPGVSGTADGTGTVGRFNSPTQLTSDGTYIYVADTGNHSIRKVAISSAAVTTVANTAHTTGDATGDAATTRFASPGGLVYVSPYLFVLDSGNNKIKRIASPEGTTTTASMTGLAPTYNKHIAGYSVSGTIHLYLPATAAISFYDCTVSGTTLSLSSVTYSQELASADEAAFFATATYLYVAVGGNSDRIYKVNKSTGVRSALGSGSDGYVEGAAFQMNGPAGLYADEADEKVYFTDSGNQVLRAIHMETTDPYGYLIAGTQGVASSTSGFGLAQGLIKGPSNNSVRPRGVEYNGNIYVSSWYGILKRESSGATLVSAAGMPPGLDLDLTLSAAGAGFLAANKSTSYRLVWGIRDANNNVILGAPSSRFTITTGGAADTIAVAFRIPTQITTSHFFQIYRADQVNSGTDPGDELYLAYERNPTSSEITAGSASFTDITPDSFLGTALYTNATQEGIAQANSQPPLARDVAVFRDHVFYANTVSRHQKTINLVGTATFSSGTSTVVIGGVTYTAYSTVSAITSITPTSEDATLGRFVFWTSGTDAQNVEATAKSLIRVINRYAANTGYYAYYASGPEDVPGAILILERELGGDAFVFTVNNSTTAALFSPQLPTSGSTFSSSSDTAVNRLYYSKHQQPEHVPLANYLPVGAKTESIQRVLALRDCLIVIKDYSIWRVTGSSSADFQVSLLDNTVAIKGRDSAAVLNNQVFCLTSQGFVAIDDNGVQVVGLPIENQTLVGVDFVENNANSVCVGGASEPLRIYLCSTKDPGTNLVFAHCYNAMTRAWSSWTTSAQCWAYQDGRLWFGHAYAGVVMRQRTSVRSGDDKALDYCDDDRQITLSSVDTAAGTAAFSLDNPSATYDTYAGDVGFGWKLYIGDLQFLVTANNGGVLTFNTGTGLTNGTHTIYRPIKMRVGFSPRTVGNAVSAKQFGEVLIVAETQDAYRATVTFVNEKDTVRPPVWDEDLDEDELAGNLFPRYTSSPPSTDVAIENQTASGDASDFGASRGDVYPARRIRTDVDLERAYGFQLGVEIENHVAGATFAIKAVGIQARVVPSDMVTR